MAVQLVWFRRDLRLADHAALCAAAAAGPVAALYVLDDETPGQYGTGWAMGAAQRWWLHHSLASLAASIAARGGRLILRRGRAGPIVRAIAAALGADVHVIRAHEPWAIQQAEEAGRIRCHHGATLAPPETVLSGSGGRYRIFTPWWKKLLEQMPPARPRGVPDVRWADTTAIAGDCLDAWGLRPTAPDWATGFGEWQPGEAGAQARLADFARIAARYDATRNLPGEEGTSRLSPHLALGEVSPAAAWHAIADAAGDAAEPWLRELGWRDFGANIIGQFPDHGDAPGRDAFARFPFRDDPAGLRAWQRGQTGYPIVDAGMRQLWATGWMHNRVRMITASFLVKHQLIDWRDGERWFWDTLLDADYGSNSLGWQWVMGSGVDSSPFNRIFAPVGQSEKFAAAPYIRRWVPELAGLPDAAIHAPWDHAAALLRARIRLGRDYPRPVVAHDAARARALAAWASVKGSAG